MGCKLIFKNKKTTTNCGHNTYVWCKISDALQTSALDSNSNYKLKNLVELFRLSSDLF
jgi:hypothetical protein